MQCLELSTYGMTQTGVTVPLSFFLEGPSVSLLCLQNLNVIETVHVGQ